MTHPVTEFNFNSHQLRVISDENGVFWFIAKEVADILEYSDAHKMCAKLDDDEKSNREIGGLGSPTGGRGIIVISESGLYSCILRSTKSEAKAFKKWVTSEVLPSIRKTSSYGIPEFLKPITEPITFADFNWRKKILNQALDNLEQAQVLMTIVVSGKELLAGECFENNIAVSL